MVSYCDWLKICKNSDRTLFLSAHSYKANLYLPTLILISEMSSLQYSEKGELCSLSVHITLFTSILPNSYYPTKLYAVFTFLHIVKYKNSHANLCL